MTERIRITDATPGRNWQASVRAVAAFAPVLPPPDWVLLDGDGEAKLLDADPEFSRWWFGGAAYTDQDDWLADIYAWRGHDLFADSSRPDDSGDGLSPATAKKTLAALTPLISAGSVVGLADGSEWREALSTAAADVTVLAYGAAGRYGTSTARPTIRGDEPVANGSFVLAAGKSNAWQAAVPYSGGDGNFAIAFEGDRFLVWAGSVDAVDLTPGTYHLSGFAGATATLTVHPFGSTDPTSDGKSYAVSSRYHAVRLEGTRPAIVGVEARRARWDSGSLVLGRNARAADLWLADGHKHIAISAGGCRIDRSFFRDSYRGPEVDNHLVIFDTNPTADLVSTVADCEFKQQAGVVPALPSSSGIISHTASGDFSEIRSLGNRFENLIAAAALGDVPLVKATADLLVNCKESHAAFDAGARLEWTDVQAVINGPFPAGNPNLAPVTGAGGTTIVSGGKICGHTYVPVIFNSANCTIEIDGLVMKGGDNSTRFPLGQIRVSASGVTLRVHNATIERGYEYDRYINLAADTVYVGDNNHFVGNLPNSRWERSGTGEFSSLAAWRTHTGQDANSDQLGSGTAACVLP